MQSQIQRKNTSHAYSLTIYHSYDNVFLSLYLGLASCWPFDLVQSVAPEMGQGGDRLYKQRQEMKKIRLTSVHRIEGDEELP